MGLQQATEQKRAKPGAKGKSKNGTTIQAELPKSKEPNSQKAKDVTEIEEAERAKEDRRAKKAGS